MFTDLNMRPGKGWITVYKLLSYQPLEIGRHCGTRMHTVDV